MPLMRLPGHMAGISPAGDSKKIAKENSIKVIESWEMKTETKLLTNNFAISHPHGPTKFSESTPIAGFADCVVEFASSSMFS